LRARITCWPSITNAHETLRSQGALRRHAKKIFFPYFASFASTSNLYAANA